LQLSFWASLCSCACWRWGALFFAIVLMFWHCLELMNLFHYALFLSP
jgi:hypothetical protein